MVPIIEVLHHSQIHNQITGRGAIVRITDHEDSVTFHDPCYLEGLGARSSSRAVIGGVDVEVERHGTDSFCCGAGGAQMWMEEDADKQVNVISQRAAETGADSCVGCPFCSVMIKMADSIGRSGRRLARFCGENCPNERKKATTESGSLILPSHAR